MNHVKKSKRNMAIQLKRWRHQAYKINKKKYKEQNPMKINKLYTYPKSMRSVINGGRHYDIDGDKLPSVTTILSATQSDEKKASLAALEIKNGRQGS